MDNFSIKTLRQSVASKSSHLQQAFSAPTVSKSKNRPDWIGSLTIPTPLVVPSRPQIKLYTPSVTIKTTKSRKLVHITNPSTTRSITASRKSVSFKSRTSSSIVTRSARSRSNIEKTPSQLVRTKYIQAVKDSKIFWLQPAFPAVRRALLARGWMEKSTHSSPYPPLPQEVQSKVSTFSDNNTEAWANRLLEKCTPHFIWTHRNSHIKWDRLLDKQIMSIHPSAVFTTKVGITDSIQNSHWTGGDQKANILFPRCYRLNVQDERNAFIGDYRLSACIALLQWVVGAFELHGSDGIVNAQNGVSSNCLDFAIFQISNYVKIRQHEDLDWESSPIHTVKESWREFLKMYRDAVYYERKLMPRYDSDFARKIYERSKSTLQTIAPFWPQMNIDGIHNIWICKPGAKSRGNGIVIKNRLEDILQLFYENTLLNEENSGGQEWVVQKYIERPLLIFNTKFDIRQWFLVSDWNPLTVWVYKESYLRFCSQQYAIKNLHSSIHLCNHAVQKKYTNDPKRNPALPKENMWDHYTFQAYLKSIEKEDAWNSIIYPGMKKAILGVLLASNENIMIRKNCFELYGADFMLANDFLPWLIEINSGPSLAYSTKVTARLCRQVLGDVIKVIIDKREDPNANPGMFELIYKQHRLPNVFNPLVKNLDFIIRGKKLTRLNRLPENDNQSNEASLISSRLSPLVIKTSRPTNLTPLPQIEKSDYVNFVERLHLKDSTNPTDPVSGAQNSENSQSCQPDAIDSKLAMLLKTSATKESLENQKKTTNKKGRGSKKSLYNEKPHGRTPMKALQNFTNTKTIPDDNKKTSHSINATQMKSQEISRNSHTTLKPFNFLQLEPLTNTPM